MDLGAGAIGRGVEAEWSAAKLQSVFVHVLIELGIPPDETARRLHRWIAEGGSFQAAMLAGGDIDEGSYYAALARATGFEFLDAIEPGRLVPFKSDLLAALGVEDSQRIVLYVHPGGRILILISPEIARMGPLVAFREKHPAFARKLRFVSPRLLRRHLFQATQERMSSLAIDRLFTARPELSARKTGTMWQGVVPGLSLFLLPFSFWAYKAVTLVSLHMLAALFFLSCISLRLLAVSQARTRRPGRFAAENADQMPKYTVLVALYREAGIVGDLMVALSRLRWPRSRLEIKLVCEADDHETISAINAHRLSGTVEIVTVPPGQPRTKPKAVTFALPAITGEFVVLYDAEDRPHPDQLLEAWHRFRASDEKLACLQAPLFISNWRTNFLTRMFAFEYAALFRGLLPWLAARGLFFPLGGTSNHFRRKAIEHVGGWDPYNVTEDADLALRLRRLGYRAGMIDSPTLEDAPDDLKTWYRQRTRWMKGWMQCLLVHNRNPKKLINEIGFKDFIISEIMFVGIVSSSLMHPFILFYASGLLVKYIFTQNWNGVELFLFALDVANLLIAYGAFFWLGHRALSAVERWDLPRTLLSIPAYWILISGAAWRALAQLIRAPHLWEKTPHKRIARRAHALVRRRALPVRRRQ